MSKLASSIVVLVLCVSALIPASVATAGRIVVYFDVKMDPEDPGQ